MWHKNVLNIENYTLSIEDKKIIVNYETNSNFSKEIYISGYKKGILVPRKASAYLGCEFVFKINNEIINIES